MTFTTGACENTYCMTLPPLVVDSSEQLPPLLERLPKSLEPPGPDPPSLLLLSGIAPLISDPLEAVMEELALDSTVLLRVGTSSLPLPPTAVTGSYYSIQNSEW